MDRNTRDVSADSEAMLSFFGCSKFSVRVCNTSDVHTGQTFVINLSKIQLSWVLMLYYPYKTMFSAYKSLIVSPCASDLFASKVTKITRYMDVRFWRSFFGAFSVYDDGILKSTRAWLLKLSVLYIHSFIQVNNTTFQIKTVFNNVLFSTEVHNPLHAHLLALSDILLVLIMWLHSVWFNFFFLDIISVISDSYHSSFSLIFVWSAWTNHDHRWQT